jgi:O-antigen ligase
LLDTVGTHFIRGLIAAFTVVVLVLAQSIFWTAAVSGWMRIIVVAVALIAYFRPQNGLLVLAVLTPFGQVVSRTLNSQMRGAEALVLAFLVGALVRGWTLREFRSFPSTRLEITVTIFAVVVAASCAEQIWFMQLQRDFVWPFAQEIFHYASRSYLAASFRGFGTIFNAMLLLEGVALLVFAARYTREQPQFADRLVAAIVAGAAGAAALTVWDVSAELFATGQAQAKLVEFLVVRRWTAHVSDVNAAGSFFALGMFIALGMVLRSSRHRVAWAALTCLFAGTTWLTHSRTALVAVLVMVACIAAAVTVGRIIGVAKAVAVAAAASVALGVALWNFLGPEYFGPQAQYAVRIRWLFLGTSWRMLVSEPLFGIGVGQYFLWSREFSAPELLVHYQRENAHNNFAQIACELGVLGFIGFAAVLAGALWRSRAESETHAFLNPAMLGAVAFIVTWLGGHPLLVEEVAYPFWLTLGVATALAAANTRWSVPSSLVGMGIIVMLISIPFRVGIKWAEHDLSRVTYGISAKHFMTSRARLFVSSDGSGVDLPVRAPASFDDPVEIDVLVDGSRSDTITLSDRNWRRARIELPAGAKRRFRQIDLQIRPGATEAVGSIRHPVEIGTWEIISKPHG